MAKKKTKGLRGGVGNIGANLNNLKGKGYPQDQALAIALGLAYGFRDGRKRKASGSS